MMFFFLVLGFFAVCVYIYVLLVPSDYDRLRASYKRETKQQSEC